VSAAATFHPLDRIEHLRDGYLKTFVAGGIDVVLVQQAGVPSILEGICPHAGHPFSDSRIIGADVRCDMHGYRFDVRSGECTYYTEGPCRALRVYRHEIREGVIGVLI
jgi:nitrite reductase/ring-hydroxylating ferredoxin subunit